MTIEAAPTIVKRINPGSILVLGAVLTSQWTGLKVLGVNLCDLLIVTAAAVVLLETAVGARRIILRWWMPLPTVGALVIYSLGEITGSGQRGDAATNIYVSGTTALTEESGGWLLVARLAMATLLMAIIVTSEGDSFGRERIVTIIKAWTLGAAISGAASVTDFFGISNVTDYTFHQLSGERALGLAFQPNSLAQTIAITLPFLVLFATTRGRPGSRMVWSVLLVLSLAGLIMSNSRGGLLSGFTAALLTITILLWGTPRGRTFLLLIVIPASLAAYFAVEWLLANTRLGGGGGAEISDAGRRALLQQGIAGFLSNPFFGGGAGAGAGVMVPLLVASTGGVFFLVTYYAFIFPTLARAVRRKGDPIVSVGAVSILALLISGFFNNSVSERYDFVVVAAVASLVYAVPIKKSRPIVHVDPVRT